MRDRLAVLKVMFPAESMQRRFARVPGLVVLQSSPAMFAPPHLAVVVASHNHFISPQYTCDCQDHLYNLEAVQLQSGGPWLRLCAHLCAYLCSSLAPANLVPEVLGPALLPAYFQLAYGLSLDLDTLAQLADEWQILTSLKSETEGRGGHR